MELPFIGLGCKYASVTINVFGGTALCGKMSGMVVYSKYIDMVVRFKHFYHMEKDIGFTALYSACERSSIPFIAESKVVWIRTMRIQETILTLPWFYKSPYFENIHQMNAYSWHIVASAFQRICFNGNHQESTNVHDGPWIKSSMLLEE